MAGTFYTDKIRPNAANTQCLDLGYALSAWSADTNYTALQADYSCAVIKLAPTLTTTRNYVMPLTSGALITFVNASGQSIQIIGASGTGFTIATGKTAMGRCDGTNWYRVTADV